MEEIFISPAGCSYGQLGFLTIVYAYVLYQSSGLISDGSELLLLVPALANLVGSIVLPILGAVPDGMMTLVSGLGENAQEEVSAGVGVLAGSTVMLLTFPWFVAIFFGRVQIDQSGKAKYTDKGDGVASGLFTSGIAVNKSIPATAKIMLVTTATYFVMQIPATYFELKGEVNEAAHESYFALAGLIMSSLLFMSYLFICYKDANEDKVISAIIKGIENEEISLGAAMSFANKTTFKGAKKSFLENLNSSEETRLKMILWPFFLRYDNDKNGTLTKSEFTYLLKDLGEGGDEERANQYWSYTDANSDGIISFPEFTNLLIKILADDDRLKAVPRRSIPPMQEAEEDEEEEEIPEDLRDKSPAEQQLCILRRAMYKMGLGTVLVLLFSDPMVDVMTEWGHRLDIPVFYISFVLAPFASNASELLAAYNYAIKKTSKSITTSISTLIGAACMNNTFVLAIFFALIYFKGLAWRFTAETIAIVLVQWIIGGIAIKCTTQKFIMGWVILACYPFCLATVYVLENVFGLD